MDDRREQNELRALRRAVGLTLQTLLDMAVLAVGYWLAALARFEFSWRDAVAGGANPDEMWVVVGVQVAAMAVFKVQRRMWRFTGFVDLPTFGGAFALSVGALAALRGSGMWPLSSCWAVPYSIILLSCVFGSIGVMGLRMLRRGAYERQMKRRAWREQHVGEVKRVVLLGAGMAGGLVARELARQGNARQRVVGFLDDDPAKLHAVIAGIPVLGPIRAIRSLVAEKQVDEAIITIANVPRASIQQIVTVCERAGIKPRIIPALHEIVCGNIPVGAVRDVSVEDLLGRDVVMLDSEAIRGHVKGNRVLVTGAGGSIGSELVRQLAKFSPGELLLLDQCEYALYEIHREMKGRVGAETQLVPIVADIADEERLEEVFREWRPAVVLHAAAYKHVPMMEENTREAVTNNVFGTLNAAQMAGKYGAAVFVMISTDKAVNPTSVMGTSKRIAELVVQSEQKEYPKTRYVSVRFGNVLGSTGSVIPLFREQIRKGGPVTVTHPDIKRYFMTIPEASRLVLQAATIGQGGEICVLDMGTPVKIAELAERMIGLSGLKPGLDIAIRYTGLRPGEKMFEELSVRGEHAEKTRHPKIFIGKIAQPDATWLRGRLEALRGAVEAGDETGIRREMAATVPEASLERLDGGEKRA